MPADGFGSTALVSQSKLLAGAGNDVFNSFGGDGFVFKGSFGNDVVNYFHPGDVTNHDLLQFAASAVADFAHLAMAQVGSNVVITIDAGVVFIPGAAFTPSDEPSNKLRLAFSAVPPDAIAEGVRRLAPVLQEAIAAL